MALAAAVPRILVGLGFMFLRLKAKRRKGVRAFRRALLRGGMGPEAANRLAADYESIGRLRTYLPARNLRLLAFRF